MRKAITPLILPPAIPAIPDPPVQAPPEQPVESDGLVPGELYDPIFSFDIPKPEIKVEPQVWDAVRENLPSDYLIPDPAFINVLSGAMDMQTMPESSPAMQQVEADEAVGPLLDASLISFIAQEVTPPSYEPMSPPETPPMPQAQQVQPKAEGSGE
ncbi:hypothetical protein N0M98_01625 [Paenibacillus doosanensis]|uniref:hypothetical protein n=1 Tax=Paenibacillus TaxID=44249 RepID=UPI00201D6A19|nr:MULTISPECIES: hypothetical protein [Paenibacillus]MCS7458826.1 hypothetical protein [Paenibacillus doosanensis]